MHLKVLIIEDCEDDAMLLGRYLKNCGFEPKWQRVDNERDLAEAVEDRRWDLVLCDFSMPKLTPFMAVHCVRQVNPDIPVIIVTGAVSEKSTAELMECGVQDVVFKSDLPRLKSSITKELALARGRRERAAAEHRFAAALENLYQGVALYDAEARLITCNRRYRMTVDRCQDEIQPGVQYGAILDLALQRQQYRLSPRSGEAIGQRLLAYDSPTGKYPIEIEQHDGRWIEVERHRTDDGGIVTVTTDITENKRREDALLKQASALAKINNELVDEIQRREATEEALRESESRANAIFQSAIDGVITFNSDYLIETVNPAAEAMFGYPAAEMGNLHIHHLMLIGEPQGAADQGTADGAPPVTGLRLVTGWRRSGEAFPIELTVSPVQLRDRTIYTGIIRDVTERTKLDRMKGEFVSMVSHELRTPLTSIMGALSLLNSNAVGELPPRARNMISIGLQNAERLLRLINDILDIEKIETGKMEFTFAPMEVRQLIEEAIQANKAFLDQFGVRAAIEVEGEADITVCGDHDRLMQVLANLISNAAKYSPEQGTITIGARCREGVVRIWVKDQGPGLPESFKDRIFQKFSQADASDTRRKGGTGLGLSIVKAIVEQHHGTVGYDSEPGKGATFYFDLALHAESAIPERLSLSA